MPHPCNASSAQRCRGVTIVVRDGEARGRREQFVGAGSGNDYEWYRARLQHEVAAVAEDEAEQWAHDGRLAAAHEHLLDARPALRRVARRAQNVAHELDLRFEDSFRKRETERAT